MSANNSLTLTGNGSADLRSNDYASQAPYWWPNNWQNPSQGDKCPYIQRDGIRNPEVDQYTDRRDSFEMMNSVYLLSLVWWHTDKAEYRQKCGEVLRTWFIDPKTAMTPHLLHAQIQPCKNSGRAIGIIDFAQQYTDVIDAVALLDVQHDGAWSAQDSEAFKAWNRQYLSWLTDSEFGKAELAAKNNHATFAGMQIAAIAAFLGDKGKAAQYVTQQRDLIPARIDPDGSQPLEIVRPTSYHYSTFTLVAWLRLVAIGRASGVNVELWCYKGPDGQSIQNAVKYILGAACGGDWPHEELNIKRFAAYGIVHYAADLGLEEAKQAVGCAERPTKTGAFWNLGPAVQQLDSILLDDL